MRIKGNMGSQIIVILIDSGSTHNFLDPSVVRKGNIALLEKETVKAKVANGEEISSEGRCPKLNFKLQRVEFVIEVHVLVLVGCNMVLRVHWLRELGPILWNLGSLTIGFNKGARKFYSRGYNLPATLKMGAYINLIN